jgi:hypothetical protein
MAAGENLSCPGLWLRADGGIETPPTFGQIVQVPEVQSSARRWEPRLKAIIGIFLQFKQDNPRVRGDQEKNS